MDIFDLSEEIRRCTACPLWKSRTLAVPGEGSKNAKIMFIGEAPGAEEDHQGIPFIGRSGKFLDTLFEHINLNRKDIFITSIVKCHPPQNRTPNSTEIHTCQELWLHKQITLLQPQLIVLLGNTAIKATLPKNILSTHHGTIVKKSKNPNRSKLRGIRLHESTGIFTLENGSQQSCGVLDPFSLNNENYFVTYHPSAAMRFPKIKKLMTQDFLKLKSYILKEKVFK